MARRVLITGASVAGNTAAWWLARHGFDVTVVERVADFREGGQNVDVRGLGREVLRRMGLEQAALDHGTGEEGTAWVDENGRIVAQFLLGDMGADGMTAEMEILRGDLARLLYDAAREQATFRFGDSVQALEQDDASVTVTFASGRRERYDAVIIAEGVGSTTRDLLFAGENEPRWMDMTIAYLTIPRAADDDRLWRWYQAPGRRSVSLRPDTHGTARAMLMLQKPPGGEQAWDAERQKAFLRERFADAGWQAPRILAAMEGAEDFYFEVLRQVRMKRWSNGRIALLGDAAWCPTPLGGIGATLAITGAYALAGELSRTDDVAQGFAAYERYMRPLVDKGQDIRKIVPRLMHPESRLGITILRSVLSLASRPIVRDVFAGLSFGKAAKPVLPNYELS